MTARMPESGTVALFNVHEIMGRTTPDRRADEAHETITELLSRLAPDVEAVLAQNRLTHEEAETALQELLILLTYRWDQLESRDIWTLATLRRLCLRHSSQRTPFDL
ncbi:MAG TPA: hypothetical protein VL025_10935 [Thermoanaerobaculia bacterium]|nr:hypothetical protein [Thermoanaerobaculia bacterium]